MAARRPPPFPLCLPRLVRTGGKSQVIAIVLVIAVGICKPRVVVTDGARSHTTGDGGRCLPSPPRAAHLPVGEADTVNVVT